MLEADGAEIDAHWTCAVEPSLLGVDTGFVDALPLGHRHVAEARGGGSPLELILYRRTSHFDLAQVKRPRTGMGVQMLVDGDGVVAEEFSSGQHEARGE